MGGDGPWPGQWGSQVSWSAEASWEGGARGQLRPGLRLSPSLREVPWLLQERGGRPDSQWHQPFREVVVFFILFFLRHESYPLESWVEEGVGGACGCVGGGVLCGWPGITSWTRVGPPGWESWATMSRRRWVQPSLLFPHHPGTGYGVGSLGDIFDLVDLFSDHLENHHNSREKTKGQTQKTGR